MKENFNQVNDCYIGSSIERSEDDTLISGKGIFGDDKGHFPGTLHVAVLRSSYGSGKIINIDTSAALAIPGVHSIIDGKMFAEISKPLLSVLRVDIEVWPCAIKFVRYVGEPIAMVLAENRYIAEDAVDNIKVSYEQFEPVIDTFKATLNDSPKVHKNLKSNILSDREFCYGEPNEAFKKGMPSDARSRYEIAEQSRVSSEYLGVKGFTGSAIDMLGKTSGLPFKPSI